MVATFCPFSDKRKDCLPNCELWEATREMCSHKLSSISIAELLALWSEVAGDLKHIATEILRMQSQYRR